MAMEYTDIKKKIERGHGMFSKLYLYILLFFFFFVNKKNTLAASLQTEMKNCLVSKDTVVLCRWGVETSVWFINRVDN